MNEKVYPSPLRPRRFWFFGSWIVVLAFGPLAEIIFPGLSSKLASGPFLLSLFILGLPHGAVDWKLTSGVTFRERFSAFLPYLLQITLALAFFLIFPLAGLITFLGLSAIHFGQSDIDDLLLVTTKGRYAISRCCVRGTILIAAPIYFHPERSLQIADDWVQLLSGEGLPRHNEEMIATAAFVPLIAASLLLLLVSLWKWSQGDRLGTSIELSESLLLITLFFIVDPLFGVGLYFLALHSWRHFARLTRVWDPEGILSTGQILILSYRKSLPLLVPSLLIISIMIILLQRLPVKDLAVTITLIFFGVVTLSHHRLVSRVFDFHGHGDNM